MTHAPKVRYLAPSWVLPLLLGCGSLTGPDDPRVELRTDREVYAVGEPGTLTVVNRQWATIEILHSGPGLCGIPGVERWEGEDWVEVGWSGICYGDIRHLRLGPGESTQIEFFVLDDSFQPGNEYRLRLSVRDRSSGPYTARTTAGFLVEE
jgi:hypothetical protein